MVIASSVAAVMGAGIAAVVLGILNLVFVTYTQFAAIAVIAMGGSLLLHSGLMCRPESSYALCAVSQGRTAT